jgi:cytochrome c oxidase cbb3-type subunit 1
MTDAVADKAQIRIPAPDKAAQLSAVDRSQIDASVRPLVLWFFTTGLLWLLFSTSLAVVTALQLVFPDFLGFSFSNFGRLSPVASVTFSYGWCSMAAMGVAAWLISRLSARPLIGKTVATLGAVLWNVGLLLGVISILSGKMSALTGLEMPSSAYTVMLSGLGLIAMCFLLSFRNTGEKVPIASMFVIAGVCWLGWSLFAGNLLLATKGVNGVIAQLVADWTSSGFLWMWLVPVSLGSAYFVIPKVAGEPIFSGPLGRGCFWLYIFVAGLTGSARLAGGPIPVWLSSLSASAALLLLVPVFGTIYNLIASSRGSTRSANSPSARFTIFGLGIFLVASLLNAVGSLRSVHYMVQFTLFDSGVAALLLNGFVTMALFGAIYFIMPRISGCEWLSSTLISIHFLGAAYGTVMGSLMLVFSGLASGAALDAPQTTFRQVLEVGSSYYWGRIISFILVGLGYAAFTLHFLLMALRVGQPGGEPTLFRDAHEH